MIPRGTEIGTYVILDPLGKGAAGSVYRAFDRALGREIALKILDPEASAITAARFDREARSAGRLVHPGIVPIHGVGEARGLRYIAMALIDGGSLASVLDRGPLPVPEALRIVRDAARALHVAHEAGLVHRDVKPSNLLVSKAGQVAVADFGLVHDEAMVERLTRTGQFVGTPFYMAPEQALCRPADRRADIHALGAVLYECLSGKRPFDGPTPAALIRSIAEEDPPSVSSLVRGLPPGVDAIVRVAMAKRPEDRYPTAAALADDIDRLLAGKSVAAKPRRRLSRRTWLLLLPCGFAVLACIGGMAAVLPFRGAPGGGTTPGEGGAPPSGPLGALAGVDDRAPDAAQRLEAVVADARRLRALPGDAGWHAAQAFREASLRLATIHYGRGNSAAAALALRPILDDPQAQDVIGPARRLFARASLDLGRTDEARAQITLRLTEAPLDAAAVALRALVRARLGDAPGAIEDATAAEGAPAADRALAYVLAGAFGRAGAVVAAARASSGAAAPDLDLAGAAAEAGAAGVALRGGGPDEAEGVPPSPEGGAARAYLRLAHAAGVLRSLAAIPALSADATEHLARALEALSHLDAARAAWEALARSRPDCFWAQAARARAELAVGDPEAARAAVDALLACGRDVPSALSEADYLAGVLAEIDDDPARAASSYAAALTADPSNLEARRRRARLLVERRDAGAARRDLDRLPPADPARGAIEALIGEATGPLEAIFRLASETPPGSDAERYQWAGRIMLGQADSGDARRRYGAAREVRTRPSLARDVVRRAALVVTCAERAADPAERARLLASARAAARYAALLDPTRPDALAVLVRVSEIEGDPAAAIEAGDRLIAADPFDVGHCLLAGRISLSFSMQPQASRIFQEAMGTFQEDPPLLYRALSEERWGDAAAMLDVVCMMDPTRMDLVRLSAALRGAVGDPAGSAFLSGVARGERTTTQRRVTGDLLLSSFADALRRPESAIEDAMESQRRAAAGVLQRYPGLPEAFLIRGLAAHWRSGMTRVLIPDTDGDAGLPDTVRAMVLDPTLLDWLFQDFRLLVDRERLADESLDFPDLRGSPELVLRSVVASNLEGARRAGLPDADRLLDPVLQGILGIGLADPEASSEAIARLASLEAEFPELPSLRLFSGRLRHRTGDLDGAAEDYAACRALVPDPPSVLCYFEAALAADLGRPDDARPLAAEALSRSRLLAVERPLGPRTYAAVRADDYRQVILTDPSLAPLGLRPP